MQRMLARVFADPAAPWILKGGTSLLVRIPGARHSQDVDLLHLHAELDRAFDELRDLVVAPSSLDRLTFDLKVKKQNVNEGGIAVWQLQATPRLGTIGLQHFPIDLTAGKQLIGRIDRIAPTPTIEIPDVLPPPEFACYPLVDQIADKLAAMYEYHGEERQPSTRWRDFGRPAVDHRHLQLRRHFDPARLATPTTAQARAGTAHRDPFAWRALEGLLSRHRGEDQPTSSGTAPTRCSAGLSRSVHEPNSRRHHDDRDLESHDPALGCMHVNSVVWAFGLWQVRKPRLVRWPPPSDMWMAHRSPSNSRSARSIVI